MGPQSDVKNWQNSAAAVQKENKRVEVLKFWHSRRQVTIFKPYCYFASTYSWQCGTEPEKMQIRRQKRGGTVNTNSGQDCSWEESGSGWYLAPSSSSLVWHKSFPYTYKQDSLQKRRRQKQRAQQNLKAIFHPIQCGHSAYLSNFRVTLSESKKINQDFK